MKVLFFLVTGKLQLQDVAIELYTLELTRLCKTSMRRQSHLSQLHKARNTLRQMIQNVHVQIDEGDGAMWKWVAMYAKRLMILTKL